jgi:ribosomal protein S18 acetylase RimI-like enzyme
MGLVGTDDKDRLTEILSTDPIAGLYHLGDLSDYYFSKCEWYIETDPGRKPSVILLYKTWGTTLVPFGSRESLTEFLSSFSDRLPDKFYGVWMEQHHDAVRSTLGIPSPRNMQRMVVTFDTFLPVADHGMKVEILGDENLSEIKCLLKAYPENFFEDYQLSTGYYRGIRIDGNLVSMAGVHTTNADAAVAAIGNVVTSREHRGRGLAKVVTSALVTELLKDHRIVGLNVGRDNIPAVKAYERLGFKIAFFFFEGFCFKR